jgi:hypothetical protein
MSHLIGHSCTMGVVRMPGGQISGPALACFL